MKAVERKLNKAQLVTVWLLIISLVLALSYVTLILVAKKLASENSGSTGTTAPEILDGEGTYLNQPIAYPSLEESQITFLEVKNSQGKFGLSRYPDDLSSFIFHYYVDGQEGAITYAPPITGAEGEFDYESLYAVETGDGYGQIYYLTYLCAALGAPYFTERIPLPEDTAEREVILREYGLTQSATFVSFMYGERDPKTGHIIKDSEEAHVVIIGDKALSGNGYYFMVDDRDYVYYTTSEYFKYALVGFGEFVKGRLVAEGLANESVYGPYLTTDFKKWTGITYKEESDRIFTNEETAYKNFENPNVVVNGGYKVSIDKGLDFVPDSTDFAGYEITEKDTFSFDLEVLLESHPDKNRIKNALVGKTVGSYAEDKIVLTLLSELYNSGSKRVEFGEDGSVRYEYSISKVEAVITDNGEITSGTVGESDTLLKVTYRYTVGGQTVQHDCHAVIDTTNLATEDAAKLVGVSIGEELGSDAIGITVDYTNESSLALSEKYVLTGVTAIFDKDGAITDVITEDTYVNISYTITLGADKQTNGTTIIRLADIKDDDKLASLKTILLGKGKGKYNETIYNREFYYELMRDFVTYEISEIEYFTANELIVSFRFENASERDPYYGDTFFKNTLSNEYKLYGLNSGSCETVVKLLGGVGTDSNSAVGLSGKTVAIGLTIDNMEKYGLYAHKIYFEMPRGIYDKSEGVNQNNDELSDFGWNSTLGFTLYISDVKYDKDGNPIRYIGSDMYDVIAEVSAKDFEFLDYGFTEFWARKHLVMMDVASIEGLKLEFNMEDLTGSYEFDVEFEEKYGAYINGEYVVVDEYIDGYSKDSDYQTVYVKASEDAFDTAFKQMHGTEARDLALLYKQTLGGGSKTTYPGSKDNYGAAYFNTVYEFLILTRYFDTLTEEEQELGFTKTKIMSMQLEVEDKSYYYTYDFYRIDDRRVMVSLYRTNPETGEKVEHLGEVSDYYITTFAFKKLVNNYIDLLNGKHIDESTNY